MAVVMPQLGESIVEATLIKWRVHPGDQVQRGQILAEVETDKATNEIPAPEAGIIGALLVREGDTVAVGHAILEYASARNLPPAATTESRADEVPVRSEVPSRLPPHRLVARPSGRGASPAVRRIARERGIDLESVAGTGRGGRVTRADVLSHGAETTRRPTEARVYRPPRYTPRPADRVVPFSRRRTFIAEHMVHSLATAAHVAAIAEIDMGQVAKARAIDGPAAEQRGIRLTYTAYVVRAVAQAFNDFPELNATVTGDALVLRSARNVGVAVDTKEGLIVPVVKHADELDLFGIARTISTLSDKAHNGALNAEDVSDGSFTVSNPGRDGNLFGISIIRQPEVGILRMGSIVKRAVIREVEGEDVIVVRPIMYAALSYDHRVIDGRVGNGFLSRVTRLLESTRPLSRP